MLLQYTPKENSGPDFFSVIIVQEICMGSKLDWTACKWHGISLQVEICECSCFLTCEVFLSGFPHHFPPLPRPWRGKGGVVRGGIFLFHPRCAWEEKDKEI